MIACLQVAPGIPESIVMLILALVVLGRRLPALTRSLGLCDRFRRTTSATEQPMVPAALAIGRPAWRQCKRCTVARGFCLSETQDGWYAYLVRTAPRRCPATVDYYCDHD